jgi:pimeloyl-ACP methyl ester carboxylesterase
MPLLVQHCVVAAFGVINLVSSEPQPGWKGFRILQGSNDIGNEVFRWTEATLDATVDVTALGRRVVTRTTYDEKWEPIEYTARVFQLAGGQEIQAVRVTFGPDSVGWVTTGLGANTGSLPLASPRGVMQNLVFSHIEALLRRPAIRAGGSETIHTFLVDNGQVLDAVVARAAATATLTIGGSKVDLELSPDGDLRSGTNAAQALRLEPAPAESLSASRPLTRPTEAAVPAGVLEEPFEWSNGQQRLAGTLARPAQATGSVPVAVIIAGSGPTDRDGNSVLGVRTDLYKKVAWALAAEGIASVRYDKRGLGGSAVTPGSPLVGFDDFADDASAGATALARDRRFSRVILIGHSEGAGLATRAANRGAPVAGVVMLSGLGRGFRTVLREQLARQFDAAQLAQFEQIMDAYLGDGPMPVPPEHLRALFPPSARRFVQTAVTIDPADEARRTPVPLLVVQGGTDIQVTVADAERLRAVRPDARVVVIPKANHLFVHAETADLASQAASYTDPKLPVVVELIPALVDFINRATR